MLRLIKLKGTDTLLKFASPKMCVPSYDHKWTSLSELLTSGNSVSADMTFTIKVQMDHYLLHINCYPDASTSSLLKFIYQWLVGFSCQYSLKVYFRSINW